MLLWDFQEPTALYQTRGDSGWDQTSPVHCEQEPMDSGRTQNCFDSRLPRTLGNKKQILPVPSEIQSLGKFSRPGLAQTCQPQFLSGLESQGFGCSWFGFDQRCRGEPGTMLLFCESTSFTLVSPIEHQSPTFLALGTGFMEDSFSMDWEGLVPGWFKCVTFILHCCYYYYISSTSDHQALDPGGWGPLS